VTNIIANGTGSIPTLITNATGSIKRTNTLQFTTTASISQANINLFKSSIDIVLDIVENGTGSIPSLVKNTDGLIKVTNAVQTVATGSTSRSVINSITSSFDTVINVISNGTGSIPSLVTNTVNNIKRTLETQYIGTGSATNAESQIISASIGIVSNIVSNGTGSLPVVIQYTSASTNTNVITAYNILKNNITFIQEETIAYLSSSWSGFVYDEEKCKRDVGFILSGSAEDLLWNSNSASIVNGKFYYEYPSQATVGNDGDTGGQLNQTLEGIEYASRLAQKVVLNTLFVTQSTEITNAYNLIRNNKSFIQSESISYISSSWSTHTYNQLSCSRDISYIIDAVTTDIYYGGNERASKAGLYYFLYPSEATGSQLDETVTGINYAKNLSNRILKGGLNFRLKS
jgi:hypothetical protein